MNNLHSLYAYIGKTQYLLIRCGRRERFLAKHHGIITKVASVLGCDGDLAKTLAQQVGYAHLWKASIGKEMLMK